MKLTYGEGYRPEIEIDVEPNAADEKEYIYVCITIDETDYYEGRLFKPKEKK